MKNFIKQVKTDNFINDIQNKTEQCFTYSKRLISKSSVEPLT